MRQHWQQHCLLLLACALACARCDLALVYSIQRHGARETLSKGSKLSETQPRGGPTLLPEGQRGCYRAGQDFRARYLLPNSCDAEGTCLIRRPDPGYGPLHTGQGAERDGQGFHNYNTFIRSSYTDRALLSAQAFLAGIFPGSNGTEGVSPEYPLPGGQQLVPVYVDHMDEEDWLIRAYTKCSKYKGRLQEWFTSDEFTQKAQETSEFRERIALLVSNELQGDLPEDGSMDGSLRTWWNMFDAFLVSRINRDVVKMPNISDADFERVRDLADWLEVAKMRSSLTGNLLGGPLLADIVQYMDLARDGIEQNKDFYKLLSISGHFNTQLGLLAALELDKHTPAKERLTWLNSTFPSFSAVLAFELHQGSGGELAVRLVAQDLGEDNVVVPLPCASSGDAAEQLAGEGACTYESFRAMAEPRTISTAVDWCAACESEDLGLCEKEQALVQAKTSGSGDKLYSPRPRRNEESWSEDQAGALAGAVVATFVGTLIIASIAFYALHKRSLHRSQSLHQSPLQLSSLPQPTYDTKPLSNGQARV